MASDDQTIKAFKLKQTRQYAAITVSAFLVAAVLWKMNHPGLLLGTFSRATAVVLELAVIAAFAVFSAFNWRCPACGRYLGPDIAPKRCRSCGSSLGVGGRS